MFPAFHLKTGGTQCFFDIMRKIFFFICGKWRCESSFERINFAFLKYAVYKGHIIGIKKGSRNHSGIGTKYDKMSCLHLSGFRLVLLSELVQGIMS